MSFQDIIDFFVSIIGTITVGFYDWVQRTAYTVADAWFLVKEWIDDWIWQARLLFDTLYLKIADLGLSLFESVKWLFTDRIEALLYIIRDQYTTLSMIIYEFQRSVGFGLATWLGKLQRVTTDWWSTISTIFDIHPDKIIYLVTDGWLRYWWFVVERWEDIFGVIEGHIAGWQTFVDDPAQALWDWIEPDVRKLVANFMVRIW